MSDSLKDVQSSPDHRNIALQKVGVRKVRWPMSVLDRSKGIQHTIGTFELSVELPHHFKGTHMSRFLEVLSAHKDEFSIENLPNILSALKSTLKSQKAYLEVAFPYFIAKKAPVSKRESLMEYECVFRASDGEEYDFELEVRVPVTTLCPCSKEISDRGAHNQRGIVTARIQCDPELWLEEVIAMVEQSASCDLYSLLKRPDEKWVTERAYDRPRFVEDIVREVALAFDKDPRIHSYTIQAENEESIHAHNAFAFVARGEGVSRLVSE
jgi:GTP cyclohydrolase I